MAYGTKSIVRLSGDVNRPRDIGTDVAVDGIILPRPFTGFVQPPPPTRPPFYSRRILRPIEAAPVTVICETLSYYVATMPAGPVYLSMGGQTVLALLSTLTAVSNWRRSLPTSRAVASVKLLSILLLRLSISVVLYCSRNEPYSSL